MFVEKSRNASESQQRKFQLLITQSTTKLNLQPCLKQLLLNAQKRTFHLITIQHRRFCISCNQHVKIAFIDNSGEIS